MNRWLTVSGIFVCGGFGSVLRYAVATLVAVSPWSTLVINITGSIVMGVVAGLFAGRIAAPDWVRASLTVGVLGGYTTFSTFSLDMVLLGERGQWWQLAVYVLGSLAGGAFGLLAAMRLVI